MEDGEQKHAEEHNSSVWDRLRTPQFKLYCSYALSTWGDRSWQFALSLALYSVGQDLQLPAVSNFVNSISVLLLGAVIGRWIDNSSRLKAARLALTVNNVTVALSAGSLVALLYGGRSLPFWSRPVLIGVAVVLCALSVLAGTGTKICVSKDWVRVISGGNRDELADINAWMLRIDLTALILSPLVAGQIMTSLDVAAGCIFVAAWNVASFALEYYLLWAVYKSVPALAFRCSDKMYDDESTDGEDSPRKSDTTHTTPVDERTALLKTESITKIYSPPQDGTQKTETTRSTSATSIDSHSTNSGENTQKGTVCEPLLYFVSGWKTYYSQAVFPAAFGMALLYLTVLGLDGITNSFIVSQGMAANVLSAMGVVGALSGISGSFVYTKLRKSIGLTRTGLFGFAAEILTLCLCVASIWLPGSPFHPGSLLSDIE